MGKVTIVVENEDLTTSVLYNAILEDGAISEDVMSDYAGANVRVYIVPSDEG